MSEPLEDEVIRLRQEVESYRQRELEELRMRLANAEASAAHFRSEAERNANLGRQIAAQAEAEIKSLRTQLEAVKHADAHTARFGSR